VRCHSYAGFDKLGTKSCLEGRCIRGVSGKRCAGNEIDSRGFEGLGDVVDT